MSNPAARVIEKCGGHKVVAEMLGVHVSRVFRWTYPAERGGTDGEIPRKQQSKLLKRAKARGICLAPNDFFNEAA